MVRTTIVLTQIESVRKQPEVRRETYELLKSVANRSNDTASKGVVAYEVLMMARRDSEPIDTVDEYEAFVDEQLQDAIGTQIPRILEKVKLLSTPDEMSGDMEFFDSYYKAQSGSDKSQLSVHLPPVLSEEYPYAFNRTLDDAVEEYMESPYRDRDDRIRCKREILEWANNGTEPEHRVAAAAVSGKSDIYEIEEAYEELLNETTEWWQRDDLTWKYIEHKQRGTQALSKHDKENRIEAVYNAWCNAPLTEEQTEKKICELFDIKPDTGTSSTYMRQLYDEYRPDYPEPTPEEVSLDNLGVYDREGELGWGTSIPRAHGCNRAEQAVLLDALLENENGGSISLSKLATLMEVAGWIEARDTETAGRYIDSLDKEFGLENLRKGTPSHIYTAD